MHLSASHSGKAFFETYWQPTFRTILDIGSLDVNGSLRTTAPAGAEYIGIDMVAGPGVDRVLDDPYVYPFETGSIDAIVSTSCFEHDPLFWVTFLEASRVVSDHGFFYINAPSRAEYHHAPDNWRFYPDCGTALESWARRNGNPIRLVESFMISEVSVNGTMVRNPHGDCVMVFSKRDNFTPSRFLGDVLPGAAWMRKQSGRLGRRERHF
jgi:SAM-dependent methyltransferase